MTLSFEVAFYTATDNRNTPIIFNELSTLNTLWEVLRLDSSLKIMGLFMEALSQQYLIHVGIFEIRCFQEMNGPDPSPG